ncbi:MAG: methyl-accepting chemotaxis protein [Saezia sp.]
MKRSGQSDDSTFASTSQLTTVLGEYGGTKVANMNNAGSKFLLLVALLFVVLGVVGGYIYMQQMQIVETQKRFQTISVQVDQLTSAAAQALKNDEVSWSALNSSMRSLQSSWGELESSYGLNAGKAKQSYDSLIKSVQTLQKLQITLTSVDGLSAVLMPGAESITSVTKDAAALHSALKGSEDSAVESISALQKIAAYVAIVLLILGILLLLRSMRSIKGYEQTVTQERNQLKALVDDWQAESEEQRQAAQERYIAAQRVNEANQAAILRLMNELQNLAEGDLTQQATVTEDITGAIADSVNYTMEELRNLVSQVQNATELVSKTTGAVESTSAELLASSDEQLREIRDTGQAVLDVAGRINGVSEQAQQSASVARQSMDAAEKGMLAVQNAIGGMNTIRDQIQDTSKRIKRLVESSQEIGEITDLIADITEQTNVLALNAAIQAASAGDAGRGFSIVAEEVQRLAERSAGATRQIATLIKTIQGDMHDAMEAMEKSTRDVVEGARQTDDTGTAFTEIDSVTRRLASLIQRISEDTQNEAKVTGGVAQSIQHIFAVTEQTANGTRSTALQVRELARVAEQLERSVARFRIS